MDLVEIVHGDGITVLDWRETAGRADLPPSAQRVTPLGDAVSMCDMCEGKSLEEVLVEDRARVEQHGWMIQAVGYGGDSDGKLPWMYTIGLSAGFGHPELVVCGLSVGGARHLIEHLVGDIRLGARFDAGETIELHEVRLGLREVHPTQFLYTDRFAGWVGYYERWGDEPERRALQLMLPVEATCRCHQQPDLGLPVSAIGRNGGPPARNRRRHLRHHPG